MNLSQREMQILVTSLATTLGQIDRNIRATRSVDVQAQQARVHAEVSVLQKRLIDALHAEE